MIFGAIVPKAPPRAKGRCLLGLEPAAVAAEIKKAAAHGPYTLYLDGARALLCRSQYDIVCLIGICVAVCLNGGIADTQAATADARAAAHTDSTEVRD